MAWIETKRRADGGTSARVIWRLGGGRGAYQSETFGAGSDAQNRARADGFKKMVEAAGQRWPEGWVRGEGFVRPTGETDPLKAPPRFVDLGGEYVRQIVDISPGQRKRYLGHLGVLATLRVPQGCRMRDDRRLGSQRRSQASLRCNALTLDGR